MDSETQENVAGELCCIGNRKGTRVASVAPRRRFRRKVATKRSNYAVQYPSLVDSEHDFMSSVPIHAAFIFLNPMMVDLLQVEYQNKNTSPFETHGPNMWIFFVATSVHCLGLAFQMKIRNSSGPYSCKVFCKFVLFSGALSSISLASVFLPYHLGWICLSLWTFLPFSVGFPLIISVFKRVYQKTRDGMHHLCKRPVEVIKCISPQKICLPK